MHYFADEFRNKFMDEAFNVAADQERLGSWCGQYEKEALEQFLKVFPEFINLKRLIIFEYLEHPDLVQQLGNIAPFLHGLKSLTVHRPASA